MDYALPKASIGIMKTIHNLLNVGTDCEHYAHFNRMIINNIGVKD